MAYPSGRTWVNALPEPVGLSWFSELGQSPSDGMAAGEKGELRSLHQVSTWFWIFVQSTNDNQDLKAVYSILAHYAIHTSAVEVRLSCNLPSFNLKRVQSQVLVVILTYSTRLALVPLANTVDAVWQPLIAPFLHAN